MNIFKPIAAYFTKMVAPPTLDEIIAIELETEHTVVIQSDHVIRTHRFHKHMAQAKIQALIAWNNTATEFSKPRINTDDYIKSALKDTPCQ